MNKGTIQLKGLQRNFPAGMNDGGCDEFINLRYIKGAFRPIGKKEGTYPFVSYENIHIHKQDDFENWIGYSTIANDVYHYDPAGPSIIQELASTGDVTDIKSLKNFLIITTSTQTIILLFDGTEYKRIDITGLEDNFNVALLQNLPSAPSDSESGDDAEAVLGKYFKKVNEHSDESKFIGGFSYRIALKLFDGTYILHTVPKFHQSYKYTMSLRNDSGSYIFNFGAAGVFASAVFVGGGNPQLLEEIKPVVSSICLFFSRNEQFYDVSEDTITDDNLALWIPNPGDSIDVGDEIAVSEGFKGLPDSPLWYKVGEVSLSSMTGGPPNYSKEMELDLEGFYQNYATKRTLPIDNFSHHDNTTEACYVYNDRLIFGNTKQILADPDLRSITPNRPLVPDPDNPGSYIEYTYSSPSDNYNGKAIITVNTGNGTKTVIQTFTLKAYKNPTDSDNRVVFLDSIFGYFDQRATTIVLLIQVSGSYYELKNNNLEKSLYSNYSYFSNPSFDPTDVSDIFDTPRRYDTNFNSYQIAFDLSSLVTPYDVPDEDNVILDNNNAQVSEVSNPFVFNAINYQQVGEGSIIAFGTNTDPISDSQFGQYPLYVFTSLGIWALEIGTGEIFFTKVVPVNGEVLLGKESKVDISFGTVYATLEGLKVVSGKQIIEISETAEGLPDKYFSDNEQLQYFLNLPQTVNVQTMVDHISFKEYLVGSKVGYSKGNDNSEIYVTNSAYDYCYMFDVKNKIWSKLSGKYNGFINNYPQLFAKRETSGEESIANMSVEVKSNVPCYFHTKGLSMSGNEIFKKLHRSFLRGFLNMASGKYAALYLFGSDDLINWTFVTGNDRNSGAFNDIWITHSNKSYRYYNYVFAAELDFDPVLDSHIKYIEFQEKQKWARKLR